MSDNLGYTLNIAIQLKSIPTQNMISGNPTYAKDFSCFAGNIEPEV